MATNESPYSNYDVGGIFAGKALSKGYKQQQELYNSRLNDIKAHMDMRYYQDPT